MKIAFIADINQHHVRRWLPYFLKNHNITLINHREITAPGCQKFFNKFNDNLNFNCYNVELRKKSFISYFRFFKSIKNIIKKNEIELLYVHGLGIAGFLASFVNKIKFVIKPYGSDILIFAQNNFLFRQISKKIFKRADLIINTASNINNKCIELGGNSDKIHMIPMGTDLSIFHPNISADHLRHQYNIQNSTRVILSARHISPLYNTDIIIKSIPLVLKKIKNIKYIIPVGTFGGDKDYLKKINKLINNLDLRGYVELPQSLEVEDMPAFHNLADIAISIPSSDSFPSFLHEAMACKVASIVSDLPAVTEFLKNKINSYVIPVRNVNALATATIELLSDQSKIDRFTNYNYALVKEIADSKKNVQEVELLFKNLMQIV